MAPSLRLAVGLAAIVLLDVTGCGGGGGGSGGSIRAPQTTTFIGNLNQSSNVSGVDARQAVGLGVFPAVQVCVAGTSFCTDVDSTGAFTLAADVGGDVVLLFDGPGFSAELALNDVPLGATVRIDDIVCSLGSGVCHAENIDIDTPFNEPPDCSAAVADPEILWPPNHQMVNISIVGVVDPDGDAVLITPTSIDQSEDEDDEPGSGNTSPDSQLDPLAVRAERSGRGDGRIYTIEFFADDGNGGTCDGVVEVCVPHDQGQNSTCG